MWNRIVFCCFFFVLVCAQTGDDNDKCLEIDCVGEGYECIDGTCYCAKGYIPNHFQDKCMRCPGLGETCMGPCCNIYGNGTLSCWQGVCQPCYDDFGKWTCSTQVIMGAALILGIIATFILLYKLCATTDIRPFGAGSNSDGRLSIGSLQLYVDERLRDAPPRYSRTPAAGSATYPAIAFLNAGFIHDSSIPPPPYTPENKTEDNHNTVNHI
ncbi:uncharacterized protein LOC111355745 isoform X2 [Spodoptera litura]|uniref:Uncharacterized protein LOC111355745 isoform X2 n=1 Tax=Spodoptera litura TaxID=69820 RepID=A0A9J7E6Z2_SPOLT|nr:uncharacterized protein LOC111355745 isoform X2 [Spodoptera litura]